MRLPMHLEWLQIVELIVMVIYGTLCTVAGFLMGRWSRGN